jgi:hypothetical protein
VDIGQQADEGIANDMYSVFCRVNEPAIPHIKPRAFGKSLFIETQPSRKAASHGLSAKSRTDGDIGRWLTVVETP